MAAYQDVDDNCDGFNLDRDQITLVRLLGTGNFGQVSKAIYEASHSEVAVKSLKGRYIYFFSQFMSSLLITVKFLKFRLLAISLAVSPVLPINIVCVDGIEV